MKAFIPFFIIISILTGCLALLEKLQNDKVAWDVYMSKPQSKEEH